MATVQVWGIDLLDVGFRWLHALMVAAWLLFDFLVYWLHFDVKNPALPIERRIERARVMHGIDRIVAVIFILTLPVGIVLCYVTETSLFSSGWIQWKHFLYGIIIVDAFFLIPISGTALRNLNAIRDGAPDVEELNRQIRRHMNIAMPGVFLVWILIVAMSLLTLLNLKAPTDREYIFRETRPAAAVGVE